MSTDTQSRTSTKRKVVGYDEFVDGQLSKVRSYIKLSDLAGRAITLAAAVMLSLILLVLVDHWVCDLGRWGRLGALVSLLLGAGYYFIRYLLPECVRQINPAYAAQVIERTEPSLKNSLINFVLLRPKRAQLMDVVYQEVEQQAAQRLSKVEIDTTVDQTSLIRILLAFLLILSAFAGYTMLSPKSPFRTLARIASPFSDIARPSRVQISDVQPGHATVYAGQRLEVSANVTDVRDDENVWLVYSTNDGQFTDERIELKVSDESSNHYLGTLPDNGARIEQDLDYRIEAGDAVAGPYRVTVSPAPTMFIDEIRYEYPAYTNLTAKTVVEQGDISAVEGTRVTIKARANHEIRSARLEFDPVRKEDSTAFRASRRINMQHTGRIAEVSFVLTLKEDRRSPTHESYHLRFTSSDGQMNANPVEYPIQVTPDLSPEIQIVVPEKIRIQVPVNYQQRIDVRAVDPDFGLAAVKLEAVKGRKKIVNKQLLDETGTGQRVVSYLFRPSQLGLKVGDFVVYRAKAADNRQDPLTQSAAPNVVVTENYAIEIVAAAKGSEGEADSPPGLTPDQPEGENRDGENGSESGSGAGQDGENGSGENGAEGQDGTGEGGQGEGGEGQGGNQDSQAGKNSQEGDQNGEGQAADGEATGEASDSGGDNGQGNGQSRSDPEGGQEGDRQDASGGDSETGQGDRQGGDPAGDQQPGNASEREGDSQQGSGQSREGEQTSDGSPPDGEQKGAGQKSGSTSSSGEEESASEPLANDGSEDPDAFDRILEHMRQQNGEQPDGTPQESEPNSGESEPSDNGEAENQSSRGDRSKGDQPEGQEAEQMPANAGDEESQSAGESGDSDALSEGTDEEPSDEKQPSDGQSGRGQSAESEGQAGDGQQTAGDEGSGQSGQETGQSGEAAGEQSGDRQKGQDGKPATSADGERSSDSGEQETGAGEEAAAGEEEGGKSTAGADDPESPESDTGATGDASEAAGDTGKSPGSEGQTGKDETGEAQAGEGQSEQPSGANSSGAEGDKSPADTAPNDQPSDAGQSAGKDPTQGSVSGESPTDGDADVPTEVAVEPGGDQAKLEYTKKATDLALKYLQDEQPDPDLLKKLGWTPEQMNEFVARWQGLQEQAQQPGDSGLEGRRELDEALRSLGLHPGRDRLRGAGSRVDSSNGVRDAGTRSLPPAEYIDQYKAYLRSRGIEATETPSQNVKK